MSTSRWIAWLVVAMAAAVPFVQRYFQRPARERMLQSLRSDEWWAEIVGSKVHLARLYEFADDSCQIVDHEGNAYSFESRARAENWMLEEGYSSVASLIEDGKLPVDFKVPSDGKSPDDTDDDELLLARMQESPDIQPFLDRAFFDSLGPEREDVRCAEIGCSYGAVEMSTLCRRHHFENVMGRPFIG